jgi:hypothetical protein
VQLLLAAARRRHRSVLALGEDLVPLEFLARDPRLREPAFASGRSDVDVVRLVGDRQDIIAILNVDE